jgi:hypothetical protein
MAREAAYYAMYSATMRNSLLCVMLDEQSGLPELSLQPIEHIHADSGPPYRLVQAAALKDRVADRTVVTTIAGRAADSFWYIAFHSLAPVVHC